MCDGGTPSIQIVQVCIKTATQHDKKYALYGYDSNFCAMQGGEVLLNERYLYQATHYRKAQGGGLQHHDPDAGIHTVKHSEIVTTTKTTTRDEGL